MKRSVHWSDAVLTILQKASAPQSAYQVLSELRASHPRTAPTTVYRALAQLTEKRCIHRLESLNAYIACQSDRYPYSPVVTICTVCGAVQETLMPDIIAELTNTARSLGFSTSQHVIELHGQCAACGNPST